MSLVGSLGLLALEYLGGGSLDDTDSDGLPHVTDSEPSQGRERAESLNTHWLRRLQDDDSSVSRLDELGIVLSGLTGTTVNLLLDLGKLASNVSGEVLDSGGRLVLRVRGDVSSLDVLNRHVLDVKSNVVSGGSLRERFVMHLHGLDLCAQLVGGESDDHAGLDNSGLDTAHWNCSNASNFVNILEGQSEGLVSRSGRGDNGVEGLKEGGAVGLAFLALNSPSLVPAHVSTGLQHVVSMPSGDGDERNSCRVVSNLLDEARHFLLNLLEPRLAVWRLSGVHLVYSNDKLLHSKGVSKQGVFSGLTVLGDASLELTGARGDNEHTTISLGSSSDHVLDEIPVSGGVDDGDIVSRSLELPECDIDGDSSLTLSLQFVEDPCVLEGSLSRLLGLLLELFNGSLVDTTALVDHVAGGGGLAGVHVTDDDNVDMELFLSHFRSSLRQILL